MQRRAPLLLADLDFIVRAVDDGLTVQAPDGQLVYANDAAARLLGYASAEELIAQPVRDVITRFEILDESGAPLPMAELPSRRALAGEAAERLVRFRVRATGEERFSILRSTPRFSDDGRLQFAINLFQDVTAERRERERLTFIAEASAQLASSLDYEATLAAVAKLAVPRIADWCAVDVQLDDGRIKRVAVEHVDPAKVALGHELERRYPTSPELPRGVALVMRTGRTMFAREITDEMIAASAVDEEHARIWRTLGLRSCVLAPMHARGRVVGVISFVFAESGRVYDDSGVKLAETIAERAALALDNARLYREATEATRAAEQATVLREQLIGVVTHDIRNPLAAIVMAAGVLERTTQDAAAQRSIERVNASAERIGRIVDQLLNFSRATAFGGLPVEPRACELRAVCKNVIDELQLVHAGTRIVLDGDEAQGTWDFDRLGELASNLVANAIQHGDGSIVTVTVRREPAHALLLVHNHGEPIPDDARARLFEPFHRGQRENRSGGLGLGLYIARQIARAHGGELSVESAAAVGTTFIARLPLSAAPPTR